MKRYATIPTIFLLLALLTLAATERVVTYGPRDGLSSTIIGGGVIDRHGLLWFATWSGLYCYDGYDFHPMKIEPGDNASIGTNRIRDIVPDDEGNIVCHTDHDIFLFDLKTYSFTEMSPDAKKHYRSKVGRSWHGLTDRQGNRWSAGPSGLVKQFTPQPRATVLAGTEGKEPRSLMVDKSGRLWVGTRSDHAVTVYDRKGAIIRRHTLPGAPYCIFSRGDSQVWIGCKPGALLRLGGPRISDDVVYDIADDSHGRLWIATFGNGIKYIADPGAEVPRLSAALGGSRVRSLTITPAGNLIAASTDGLLVGNIDSLVSGRSRLAVVKRVGNDPGSLSNNSTMSVVHDGHGNIYVATESSGIDVTTEKSLLSPRPRFTHLDMKSGSLPSETCLAMTLAGDSSLIVVSNDNVMLLDTPRQRTINFNHTYWGDSCRFDETTPVRLHDGSWAFGARQGVFVTPALAGTTPADTPPIVFTTISVNSGTERFSLPPLDTVSLKPDQRNLTIGYAAIDYIDNSDIIYSTRLDGSPWTSPTNRRSVTLFNLAPGCHTLEVKSTDRYGRPADNTRRLTIVIAPLWHETWWARLLFVLLTLALLSGIAATVIYIRRVNRHRRELLEKYMALILDRESPAPTNDTVNTPTTPADDADSPAPPAPQASSPLLDRVRKYIEDNLDNPDANVDDMASAAAASRSTLNRHLRSQLGISAARLLAEARMKRAEALLADNSATAPTVNEIATLCGYSDIYYFRRVFKQHAGHSPEEYRETCGHGTKARL